MKKRLISLLLACFLAIPSAFPAMARDTSLEENIAADLKTLGLFKGVSETDFDLNREPSRVEALVILIRVLGKESEALNGTWNHPFTDVPSWADKYIGYAYETGLTYGVSETEFGAGNAGAGTFLTFVLRALGYSDTNGADFSWQDPYTLAETIGILPDRVNRTQFWRSDVALVSYAALDANLKNSATTLSEKLIDAGVFTSYQFTSCYDLSLLETAASAYSDIEITHADSSMTAERIAELVGAAVFWAPQGDKTHIFPTCRSFKDGMIAHYAGTLKEAQTVRTDGWCKWCLKDYSYSDDIFYQQGNPYATVEALADSYTYEDYLNCIPAVFFD